VTSRRRRLQPLSARRARVLSSKRPDAAEFVASGGTARRRHRAPCPQRAAETQHRAKQQQLSQPAPPREAGRDCCDCDQQHECRGRSRPADAGQFQFVEGWANLFASCGIIGTVDLQVCHARSARSRWLQQQRVERPEGHTNRPKLNDYCSNPCPVSAQTSSRCWLRQTGTPQNAARLTQPDKLCHLMTQTAAVVPRSKLET
jgi:hypothetical protein